MRTTHFLKRIMSDPDEDNNSAFDVWFAASMQIEKIGKNYGVYEIPTILYSSQADVL